MTKVLNRTVQEYLIVIGDCLRFFVCHYFQVFHVYFSTDDRYKLDGNLNYSLLRITKNSKTTLFFRLLSHFQSHKICSYFVDDDK